MKVALYTRVSTEDQAREGFSLEVQRDYLLQYAKNFGWDAVCTMSGRDVYMDDGYSGGNMDRPAMQRLLFDAKNKHFDLVLVYKQDRLSRRLKDLLGLLEEFETLGIGYKSATEPFDTTTSAGKLMFQQLGSFAEFERNRIAERVFPGMVKGVQQGRWQGARFSPFGYTYNKAKKLLEIEKREADIVKLIYTMYLAGKSTQDIAIYLNRKKYQTRTGKQFYNKFICDILKNRIYTGKLVWNRHHYDKNQKTKKGYAYVKNSPDKIIIAQGKHEALVSEEDFNLAQEKLKQRRIEIKRKKSDYPLSGILYCAKCNHRYLGISSISNHRTNKKKRWYRCNGPQRSFIKCKNKSVKAEDIEPKVAALLDCLLRSETLKKSRWTTGTEIASAPSGPRNDVSQAKNKLKVNQEKQSKLTDAYLENLLGEDVYRDKMETLRGEEDGLKKLLAGYELREIESERSEGYLNRVKDFLEGCDDGLTKVSFEQKRQMAGLLFKNIKIAPAIGGARPQKRISFSLFAPFNLLFLETKEKQKCQQNQRISKIRRKKSTSELSAAK